MFTLVAISCLDQPDCYNLTNSNITIAFRKIADGRADTLVVLERYFESLDSDSAFINTDTVLVNGSSLEFPIDYLANGTNYSIKEIEKTNLLELGYKVQSQFVSEECGPRFFVSDLSVVSSNTDSVRITSAIPGSGTNVTIYRCPRTNLVKLAVQTRTTTGTFRKDTMNILSTTIDDPITLLYPIVDENISFLKLPVDLTTNTTQVEFVLEGNLQRSITFEYDRIQATRYAVCGQQTFITNLRVAETTFDDLRQITTTRYKSDSIYDPPRINFAIIQ